MSKKSQKVYSTSDLGLPKKIQDEIERACKRKKLTSKQKERLIARVKKEYLNSSFEPGEAIGIISAQSISEPSTQMSLSGSEKILIRTRGMIEVTKIDDFVDSTINEFGFKKISDSEVCDLPSDVDVYVLSLNQNEKMRWKRIKSCIRHKSPEKLMKLKTKSGRKIIATDFHSFVIRDNNRIVPISGKELKLGDRIPVIKHLPENCTQVLNISNFVPLSQCHISDGSIRHKNPNFNVIPEKINLNESFGWFVGAYLSEGSITENGIFISNVNENFLFNTRKFAENLGINYLEYDYKGEFGPDHFFVINSPTLSKLFLITCNKDSYNKKVPEFAFSAPEGFVSNLLKGYFDGDGSVSVKRKMIRVHSNSEELIDGIKLLLTRFGIFAYKHKETKQHYLLIPYKYAPVFLSKIGSDIKEKRKRLEKLSGLAKNFWKNKSYDFTDMISNFGDIFYRVAKKLKYPTRYVNNFTKRQKIGRTTLYRYIKLFEKLAKEKNLNIKKELKILKRMFNSDVVWDEIKEISYIKPENDYVYDVSVDGLETFTTFDGIVTHNTMRTFHFAGSAGIQVTLGLPRLIEIFDARKEPTTPMMNVYLKKEYNTRKDSENIAKKIKERRLRDFVEVISLDLTNKRIRIRLKKIKKSEKDTILTLLKEKFKKYRIKTRKNSMEVGSEEVELSVKDLQKLKKKLLDLPVFGVPKVRNTVVFKEGKDWVIKTLGSNLDKVLRLNEVDPTRCYTNNVYEIAEVLGIEAARNALIKEIINTMQQQGLDVDERHIMLITDIMTLTGKINSVGRYGVAGMKSSVLTRAGFEETIKHLVKASVRNEVDDFNGIFENVMVNQQVPVGTGMFELIAKMGK